MRKKIILIDLDGVLNCYEGNFSAESIPPIKDGAKDFLTKLSVEFEVKLFTTRNKILASKWLIENGLDEIISDITNIKELCWLFVDDRCVNFDGDHEKLFCGIRGFTPWYKKRNLVSVED